MACFFVPCLALALLPLSSSFMSSSCLSRLLLLSPRASSCLPPSSSRCCFVLSLPSSCALLLPLLVIPVHPLALCRSLALLVARVVYDFARACVLSALFPLILWLRFALLSRSLVPFAAVRLSLLSFYTICPYRDSFGQLFHACFAFLPLLPRSRRLVLFSVYSASLFLFPAAPSSRCLVLSLLLSPFLLYLLVFSSWDCSLALPAFILVGLLFILRTHYAASRVFLSFALLAYTHLFIMSSIISVCPPPSLSFPCSSLISCTHIFLALIFNCLPFSLSSCSLSRLFSCIPALLSLSGRSLLHSFPLRLCCA